MFAGKSLGTKYRADGYTPKKPVMIIPGLCSSCLKVTESPYEPWVGKRIWLSMSSIGFEKMWAPVLFGRGKKKNSAPPVEGDNEVEEALKRRWLAHMCLAPDGLSDPPGIKLRAVKGLKGCKYLDPGALTDALSYVMGPLAEMLEDLGYEDGVNLDAVPYDWRLPPYRLEERDNYFSELQKKIENMYHQNDNTKVVIIAHSLGNRVTHYFTRFMEKKAGREWASKYLDNWLAIGPLWLGAPKLLRAIITGDRMGLEAFLFPHEGITLARSLGSTPWMFPYICPEDHEFTTYSQFKDPTTGKYIPTTNKEILINGGAEIVYNRYRDFFEGDPLVGIQDEVLKAPPIDKIYAIYGINLKTETFYFFKENPSKKKITDYTLDSKGSMNNFKCEGGVAYETKNTRQNSLKGQKRGGDGTVPYPSLSYCRKWKGEVNVKIAEIEGAEHREILKNKTFLQLVLEYVSQAPPPAFLPVTFNDIEFSVKYEAKGKQTSRTLILDKQYIRTKQSGGKEIRQYYGNVSNIILDEQTNTTFFLEYDNTSRTATYYSPQSAKIVQEIAARCRYIAEAKASYTEDRNEYGQTALHTAAINNDVSLAIDILKGPMDINAVDLNGNTPLIAAAEKGYLDMMIVLLQQSNINVNKQANNNKSVIHHMCNMRVPDEDQHKWVSVMNVLKRKGIDLNAVADFGETPLHQAIKRGKYDIIDWLINNSAQVNATNNIGETPLHYTVRIGRKDIVELLLSSGADRLKEAPTIGSSLSLAKKIDNDLMVYIRDFSMGAQSNTGSTINRVEAVGGERDEHGRTPLHIAASDDRLDLVFSLLLKNASVNDTDKNGWTPLHCAACNGHLDVLTVLTNSYGVDVNSKTDSGSTVLHYVMRIKHFNSPQDQENYLRILDILKQKGASINSTASRGITPVHEATLRGNIVGVRWILANGGKVNIPTEIGFTPLHFAVQSKSMEVIKLLVESGANPTLNSQAGSPLDMAKGMDQSIYQFLLSAPIPKEGSKPARPPRRITSSSHRLNSTPKAVDMSVIDDEEEEEDVIYTLNDQEDEEDVPGSTNEVIPLAQRRRSTIYNINTRPSYSVIFKKPPVGSVVPPKVLPKTPPVKRGSNIKKQPVPRNSQLRSSNEFPNRTTPKPDAKKLPPNGNNTKLIPPKAVLLPPSQTNRGNPRGSRIIRGTPPQNREQMREKSVNDEHRPVQGIRGKRSRSQRRGSPTRGFRGVPTVPRGSSSPNLMNVTNNRASSPTVRPPSTLPPAPARDVKPTPTKPTIPPPTKAVIPPKTTPPVAETASDLPVGCKFCTECGTPRIPKFKFCGECGFRFPH